MPRSRNLASPALRAAVVAMVVAIAASVSLHAATVVNVLDWNIHRDIGASDSNTASQTQLAKVVNYLAPDIWTINELGGNNVTFDRATAQGLLVDFITSKLTIFGPNPTLGSDFYVYVGTIDDNYITSAIVSRYAITAQRTYSDGLRGLEQAYVNLPGAVDLGVFTTHMKALNSTSDAERRQSEANTDAGNISAWISGHAGAAVIVTGDWNETEDPEDNDNWSSGAIGGPLPSNGAPYHPVTTMRSAGNFLDAKPLSIRGDNDTIDSDSPTARFDYILYSGATLRKTGGQIFDTRQYTASQLSTLNSANGTNFLASDSANASDHLPVFATFEVIPEPGAALLVISGFGALLARRRTPARWMKQAA